MGAEIRNDKTLAVISAITAGAEKGILETVIKVTSQAKELAPVDTGELKNSGFYKAGGLEGVSGFNSDHAVYQELGTRKMAAQPYLRPAVDIITKGATAKDAMEKAMRESVRAVT